MVLEFVFDSRTYQVEAFVEEFADDFGLEAAELEAATTVEVDLLTGEAVVISWDRVDSVRTLPISNPGLPHHATRVA